MYQTISCVYCIISAELQLYVERTSVYYYRHGNCWVLLQHQLQLWPQATLPSSITSLANAIVF